MVHAMADLGSELRLLRAARGMSLNELARQAPCDPGYLSKVVRGQKRASPRLLARLGRDPRRGRRDHRGWPDHRQRRPVT